MVLVFKTSISSDHQIAQLQEAIDQELAVSEWNFDLEDCDRIFRVLSKEPIVMAVIDFFKKHGHECEELI